MNVNSYALDFQARSL